MKYLPRFLLIIILISFLNSTSIAQPETNVSEVDTLAYFPHWELIKGGKTQTTLYVTFLGPEEYSDSIKIFVRFFVENGGHLEDQEVKLYQANNTYTTVTTSGGYVYFYLFPRQTAKIFLTTKRFEKPISFGYATMGWEGYSDQLIVAKFLAWGEVTSGRSGFLSRSRSEASISVNGGLPFLVRGLR